MLKCISLIEFHAHSEDTSEEQQYNNNITNVNEQYNHYLDSISYIGNAITIMDYL